MARRHMVKLSMVSLACAAPVEAVETNVQAGRIILQGHSHQLALGLHRTGPPRSRSIACNPLDGRTGLAVAVEVLHG